MYLSYSSRNSALTSINFLGMKSKRQKFDDGTQNKCILRSHLEGYYRNTRYARELDDENQSKQFASKHYTSLVLSYPKETTKVTTKDLSEVFSILDQSNSQHIILVKGSTGIGKTELLKHIAYCWAGGVEDCKLLEESDFVFLLCLKDCKVQEIDTLEKLIYCYNNSKYIESYVNKLEEKQGRSVVLLLDGYDEYPTKLKKDGFIANLLQRYVLPYCSIVISSHPHASQMLNATFEVEIVGFDEKGQDDFVQKSLVAESDNISKLDTYRRNDPAIASFCSIPLNMSVLVAMFKQENIHLTNMYYTIFSSAR